MDSTEYQKLANNTNMDETGYEKVRARMTDPLFVSLMHAAMGMVTEAGEFMDMLKKHAMYGKPLDMANLKEEVGDQLWYNALALNTLGVSFEAVMQTNIDKLKVRFPDKFTEQAALNRDLEKERAILEK